MLYTICEVSPLFLYYIGAQRLFVQDSFDKFPLVLQGNGRKKFFL